MSRQKAAAGHGGDVEEGFGEERSRVELVLRFVRMVEDYYLGPRWERCRRDDVAEAHCLGPVTFAADLATTLGRRRRAGGLFWLHL